MNTDTLKRNAWCIAMLALCVAVFAVVVFVTDGVEGRTITVDDDGGADYKNIQDAINASKDGDTVRVWEGVYYENVIVNKTVNLIGNGSADTIIDGGGEGESDVVMITADWCNMSGFTTTGSGTYRDIAGIRVKSDHNKIFENNCSDNEYGISVWDSENNTVTNNNCSSNSEGGIFLGGGSNNAITNNNCSSNEVGIYLESSDYNTLANNTCNSNMYGIYVCRVSEYNSITDNTCSSNDAGICLFMASNNTISNNRCTRNYYGIDLKDNNDHNTLFNNFCDSNNGDGIYLYTSDHNTLANNSCDSNNGDGIYIYSSYQNTLTNNSCYNNDEAGINFLLSDYNTLANNTCSSNGRRGIHLYESNYNAITNITCSFNDGGIYLEDSSYNTINRSIISGYQKGICMSGGSESNSARYNSISDNTEYGIDAFFNDGYTINATYNWWGHSSGPYHPTANPDGQGDNITDYVDFDPWLENPPFADYFPPEAIIDPVNPDLSLVGERVYFSGHGSAYGSIMRYAWRSSIDGEFYNSTDFEIEHSGLAVGEHTIFFKVMDNYGVWSDEDNTTLTVHRKPVAEIISISPDPALDTDTIQFTGQGTDDGTIERYVWTSSINGELYNSTGTEFNSPDIFVGEHTIFLKVMDNYGVWSDEVNTTLVVHRKPVAEIISISPDPALDTDTIQFTGQGTDDDSISLYVWTSSIDSEYYNSTEAEFNYTGLSAGEHTISFEVMDNYGVWSNKVNRSLTIHEKPVAEIISINPSPALDTDTIRFSGNGTDDGTVTKYAWRSSIDDEFYNGTEAAIEYPGLSVGEHTIFLKVMDNNGVWSDEVSATLTVNSNIPPVINIISHANHSTVSGDVTIRGTVADMDGTVEKVEISINDGSWIAVTGTESWSFEWDSNAVVDGEHTLKLRAFDGTDYSVTVEITLDVQNVAENSIPTITITSPANNSITTGAVTIKGAAHDDDGDGTIQKVEVSINDANWISATGTTSWDFSWDTTQVANGDYEIRVRAFDGEDYSDVVVWKLTVDNQDVNPPDDDDDDDDDSPGFGGALLLLAVAVATKFALAVRRKASLRP